MVRGGPAPPRTTPAFGRKVFDGFACFWTCANRLCLINVRPLLRQYLHGALAQLGERLHGMQEVRGSTPLGSTIFILTSNSLAVIRL